MNFNPSASLNDGSCHYGVRGCTDSEAENYQSRATLNDGSCTYVRGGCCDPEASNFDFRATFDNGSCRYDCFGCTDPLALNYDIEANIDNDTCEYRVIVRGCKDPAANNFNALANTDNGSCHYNILGCTIRSSLNFNFADDSACRFDIPGCTDISTINYGPNPTWKEHIGSRHCELTFRTEAKREECKDALEEWNNDPADLVNIANVEALNSCSIEDLTILRNMVATRASIEDGSCIRSRPGCMDTTAFNFNSDANVSDPSLCVAKVLGCKDSTATNFNSLANTNNG
jgi:hypothetical protein